MEINYNHFIGLLRSALHSLYDPDQLRRSSLIDLLGITNKATSPFVLQKILTDAIENMLPAQGSPPQARGWLLHDVLFFRYVRGYEREAVANQLGFSDRQLSREIKAALEVLAHSLWEEYRLESNPHGPLVSSTTLVEVDQSPANNLSTSGGESLGESWIENLPAEKPASWKTVLESVLELLRPLIHQNGVSINFEPGEDLPDLMVPQNTVRHSLMNILGWIIPFARGRQLIITIGIQEQGLIITVAVFAPDRLIPPAGSEQTQYANVEIARSLVERLGGAIQLIEKPDQISVILTIPALAQIPVLVIDDNADTIQLFQRYAQGTRYSVTGASGAEEFYQLVDKIQPRVILIDLMMPEVDGWDLLYQLRQSQQNLKTAIIICSILPQENLARSLGADGFLQKPTLPEDFLRTLDYQIDRLIEAP